MSGSLRQGKRQTGYSVTRRMRRAGLAIALTTSCAPATNPAPGSVRVASPVPTLTPDETPTSSPETAARQTLAPSRRPMCVKPGIHRKLANCPPKGRTSPSAGANRAYNQAAKAYRQKRWAQCADAFDAALSAHPHDPRAAQSANDAAICYQMLSRKRRGYGGLGRKFTPRTLSPARKRELAAYHRAICYHLPQVRTPKQRAQLVEFKYAQARLYLEEQHWPQAAVGFRDVAFNPADTDAGSHAAMLYLETLYTMAQRLNPPQTSCLDDIRADLPKLIALYCPGSEYCGVFAKVKADLQ